VRIETPADRVRGVIVRADGLHLDNPLALVYAASSCGGEPAGERAALARQVRETIMLHARDIRTVNRIDRTPPPPDGGGVYLHGVI
jgi:hypothetical protein